MRLRRDDREWEGSVLRRIEARRHKEEGFISDEREREREREIGIEREREKESIHIIKDRMTDT